MIEFRFSWTEKWEATVTAESFAEAQEKFDNLDRPQMDFCGSENYEVTVSERDMMTISERGEQPLVFGGQR